MNFWQVAAGEGVRDYSEVFTRFGVMLIGGGDPGSFLERPEFYRGHHDWRSQVVAFAEQVHLDDAVILKRPHRGKKSPHGEKWDVVAVGRVTGEYGWMKQFEDVEGWDIQHCRKVEWVQPSSPAYADGFARGTFRKVHKRSPGTRLCSC